MNLPESDRELDDLLDQLCEDFLSDAGWQRLAELLAQSEACRRRYLDTMELHAALWSGGAAPPVLPWGDGDRATKPATHSSSPVLGFLGGLASGVWQYVSCRAALVCGVAATLLVGLALATFLRDHDDWPVIADSTARSSGGMHASGLPQSADLASVARMVRTYDCIWSEEGERIADGDSLKVGERMRLRSGLAEIRFDCGARVILQGPASLLLDSSRTASLFAGKVTVRAEIPSAKGFAIHTPGMKAIDLGTEFGLEVSPIGIEQVHVFRGEVVVSPTLTNGPSVAPQHLTESQGIEVNPNTRGVKLVANNGERFARSLDQVQNARHVLAYWRFEDHTVGVLAPDTQEGKAPIRASLDSSMNGNDLYTWNKDTQPGFSADVPAQTLPGTGEPNLASLDTSRPPAGGMGSRDLFTNSSWSQPSPVDLQSITPLKWTIEASVKVARLREGLQGIVVRDGMNVCAEDPKRSPFVLQINPQEQFEVIFCDIDGREHRATCAALTVQENHWYHVAASSDGAKLKLYVDALDGKGYRLWAVTELPSTGSTALARGVWPKKPQPHMGHPYIWSVGRGYYDGYVAGWFQGLIDEVRISDVAREPAEFLFSPRVEGLQTARD